MRLPEAGIGGGLCGDATAVTQSRSLGTMEAGRAKAVRAVSLSGFHAIDLLVSDALGSIRSRVGLRRERWSGAGLLMRPSSYIPVIADPFWHSFAHAGCSAKSWREDVFTDIGESKMGSTGESIDCRQACWCCGGVRVTLC